MFIDEISPATQAVDGCPGVGWASNPPARQNDYKNTLEQFEEQNPRFGDYYSQPELFQPSFHQLHAHAYLGALRVAKSVDEFLNIAASNLRSAGIDPMKPHEVGMPAGSDWVSGVGTSRDRPGYASAPWQANRVS